MIYNANNILLARVISESCLYLAGTLTSFTTGQVGRHSEGLKNWGGGAIRKKRGLTGNPLATFLHFWQKVG